MANFIDTKLECLTNYSLLRIMDPKKIIIKTNSEFRFQFDDELVFESCNETMHKDILSLSEKFPNEVFLARYYDIQAEIETPAFCVRYANGKDEFIGYEPIYTFVNYEHLIKAFGEEIFHRMWKRIREYLFRLDKTQKSILDEELHCDILEHHYDNCVSSYATIHTEYENFKLTVDKTRNSELTFRGYRRNSPSEEWVELPVDSKNEKTDEKQHD